MKTLLTLVLTAFFSTSMLMGMNDTDPDPLTVQEQIKRTVNFKTFAKKYNIEGKVEVTFYIDELHMIQIQCIYGDSDQMVKYVRNKMNKKEIYGENLLINQSLKMTFEYYEISSLGMKPKSIFSKA